MPNMKDLADAQAAKVAEVDVEKNKKANEDAKKAADEASLKAFSEALKVKGPVALVAADGKSVTVYSTSMEAGGFKSEVVPVASTVETPTAAELEAAKTKPLPVEPVKPLKPSPLEPIKTEPAKPVVESGFKTGPATSPDHGPNVSGGVHLKDSGSSPWPRGKK
jgi:hypothetical protein